MQVKLVFCQFMTHYVKKEYTGFSTSWKLYSRLTQTLGRLQEIHMGILLYLSERERFHLLQTTAAKFMRP